MRRTRYASALALSVLVLTSCGGGGRSPDGAAGFTTAPVVVVAGGPPRRTVAPGSGGSSTATTTPVAGAPSTTTTAVTTAAPATTTSTPASPTSPGGAPPVTRGAGSGTTSPASVSAQPPAVLPASRATTSPAAPATSAREPSPATSATTPVATGNLVVATCSGPVDPGDGGFDLVAISVRRTPTGYAFAARYSGATKSHHVLIRFALSPSSFLVDGELFEDGKGVGRILDTTTSEETFLDPPQTITGDEVDLAVRADQLPGLNPAGLNLDVTMQADGEVVETCPV